MLFHVKNGDLEKIQLSKYPQCAIFEQKLVGDNINVRYLIPEEPLVPHDPKQDITLEVPLEPDLDNLERADVNLHNSMVSAYRMGKDFDDWFTACFGFETILVYIGDQRRPVLGTFSPRSQNQQSSQKGWLSSITNYVSGGVNDEPDWLTFTDCAPFLIATEASLASVSARLEAGDMEMIKFRPNIVVDGEGQWDEDFWAELSLNGEPTFVLSKMCGRCTSVNVDYATGRVAANEYGTVLKKLMSDRRVDTGNKWSPVFGRYGFLSEQQEQKVRRDGEDVSISLGDELAVSRRAEERPVWDWPMKDKCHARFYGQRV